jgi:hypothetical protein
LFFHHHHHLHLHHHHHPVIIHFLPLTHLSPPRIGIKRAFSRHGRALSGFNNNTTITSSSSNTTTQQSSNTMPSHQNGWSAEATDSNERTPLITTSAGSLGNTARSALTNGNGKPLSEDERWWVRTPSNFVRLTWLTLASNYVNLLLVCVPAGIIVGAMDLNPTAVFVINFFAIVPLAGLLSFATEELSVKLGQTIGGLMNATFGNAVELIVSFRLPPSHRSTWLTGTGVHCCPDEGRDPNRASEHARFHPIQHPSRPRVLLYRIGHPSG